MIAPLLAQPLAMAPASITWSPKVALVMIVCNVIAIAIGKATIKHQNVGLQLPNSAMFGGMSHGAMLGTLSLGHILGVGAILGLASRGVV
jgi:photosystem I subunit 10